ncbi:hypothetical protein L6452_02430 [Arctium lappa]|uniref:Uncharacterized protein n=1 Tax=Arctium lappa TaxID=4217 RepID=A0ACB9FJD9_ARCLA|nr:hypothetical protein L6452_02430 [Arctium lappa]
MESTTLYDDDGAANNQSKKVTTTIQIAMVRLEDEFHNILISHATPIETESLTKSISSTHLTSRTTSSIDEFTDADNYSTRGEDDTVFRNGSSSLLERGESNTTTASYRSMSSIREIDLIPCDNIHDLCCIVEHMIDVGYFRECVQVYDSVQRSAIDSNFKELDVEKLSIDNIQRLEWEALNIWVGWISSCRQAVFRYLPKL